MDGVKPVEESVMGACGCAAERLAKFPAPGDKNWYVLEVYPGCEYCDTDLHITVTEVKEGSDQWQFFEDTPEAGMSDLGWGWRGWYRKILDSELLVTSVQEWAGCSLFREFVDRGGLRRILHRTLRGED